MHTLLLSATETAHVWSARPWKLVLVDGAGVADLLATV